jgi:hypothetical protein
MFYMPPPRCCARRKPTFTERLRAFLLGPIRGFDMDHEPRCRMYEGHARYGGQEQHEDYTGRKWL